MITDLEEMDQYLSNYTYIDEDGHLMIVYALGVYLTDLLEKADIAVDEVSNLHFFSTDPETEQDSTVSFTKEDLLETTRYCNYSLENYYEEESGQLVKYRRWSAEPVEALIALQDYWVRAIDGGSFEDDGEEFLTNSNHFRLIFGQADRLERMTDLSLRWIHTIAVELNGTPPPDELEDLSSKEATNKESLEEDTVIVVEEESPVIEFSEIIPEKKIEEPSQKADPKKDPILPLSTDITESPVKTGNEIMSVNEPKEENTSLKVLIGEQESTDDSSVSENLAGTEGKQEEKKEIPELMMPKELPEGYTFSFAEAEIRTDGNWSVKIDYSHPSGNKVILTEENTSDQMDPGLEATAEVIDADNGKIYYMIGEHRGDVTFVADGLIIKISGTVERDDLIQIAEGLE